MENDAKEFLQELKEKDLVEFLSSLGHEPAKPPRGRDVWYHSPLHADNTPSFKVDIIKNCWFDHSMGKGGNLVDFAVEYHNCTVGEFMAMMRRGGVKSIPIKKHVAHDKEPENPITITKVKPLFRYVLLNYLRERRIDIEVADKYCREVDYSHSGKNFYGIGFKNDLGGYEIRNPKVKSASSPKDITLIKNGSDTIHVFEGFFDFLTFVTIFKNQPQANDDFLVLNSASLADRALPLLAGYNTKNLYLDNDTTGDRITSLFRSSGEGFHDMRKLYGGYNDLNEWHCRFGNRISQQSSHHHLPARKANDHGLSP